MPRSIAVIGAGAKAAAIVARTAVLKGCLPAASVPEIHVFEKYHIGSAWSGDGEFTNGFLTLCTPGEKDVGYPYAEIAPFGQQTKAIAPAMFANFSWSAYLVATGLIADWVDRGRDHPLHRQWTEYLQWVFDQAGNEPTFAEVTSIEPVRGKWVVSFLDNAGAGTLTVDAVVITGTGRAKIVPSSGTIPAGRVLNSEDFWSHREQVGALTEGVVAVAGNGGSAGSIAGWLAGQYLEKPVTIASISPQATLFPRGDGFAERRWFSDPSEWRSLAPGDRKQIIARTASGVISLRIKKQIDLSQNIQFLRGRATQVSWDSDEQQLKIDIEYDGATFGQFADYLIAARGFDPFTSLELVAHPAVRALADPKKKKEREAAEESLQMDLSLDSRLGAPPDQPVAAPVPPGLHVPALGGFARGPGISNLGCLGLMAKAIVDQYIG